MNYGLFGLGENRYAWIFLIEPFVLFSRVLFGSLLDRLLYRKSPAFQVRADCANWQLDA